MNSKVREAIALQDTARQNLETARRVALFNAQTGFTGVTSSVASVKAFGQAVRSADVAYQSNKLGQEVGVRTNLDVLNTQQNVYTARRDLAQAYFNYLIGVLRLSRRSARSTIRTSRTHRRSPRATPGSFGASHSPNRFGRAAAVRRVNAVAATRIAWRSAVIQ